MRTRRIVVAVLAALATTLLVGALDLVPAAAVAHGTLATRGQYPFAVRLTMSNVPRPDGTSSPGACSAALISPTWIITAGHCFHDKNRVRVSGAVPYPTLAKMNTVNVGVVPGEGRWVTYVKQSPVNDIALAKLSSPVTDVRPLGLNTSPPAVNQLLTIAGWGATTSINPVPSTQLDLGVVKIRSVTGYTVLVGGYSPAADTSACAYDSGAPYFRTSTTAAPRLVSVESSGPDCPHALDETTSRVDTVTKWIVSTATDLPR
jgi:secreted trypsin-like serine protease